MLRFRKATLENLKNQKNPVALLTFKFQEIFELHFDSHLGLFKIKIFFLKECIT